MSVTLQIQSVIYNSKKDLVVRSLKSLANAVKVNRNTVKDIGEVSVCLGDVSAEPIFTDSELADFRAEFKDFFTLAYTFFGNEISVARCHNLLGESCKSDYIMIKDAEAVVCPRILSGMLEPFSDAKSNVGMVEARKTPLEDAKEYDRKTLETEVASAACVMVSAEDFHAISGFDADLFPYALYGEDFSWRIRLNGKRLIYRPDCVVFCAERLSASDECNEDSDEAYYSQEAALLMAYKWSNKELFKKFYDAFSAGDEIGKRVVTRFDQMKADGKLPKPLECNRKIAKFYGCSCAKNRYVI